jgi:ferric-dicitrate binding protein FerR (iron transport regulator)
MENSENDYFILIAKKLKGEISPEEEALLEEWISESNHNKNIYDETSALWKKVDSTNTVIPNVEHAWEKVRTRTVDLDLNTDKSDTGLHWSLAWKVAAAFILVIGLSYFVKVYLFTESEWTEVAAQENKLQYTLPDSSKIWINRNSKISFSGDYGSKQRMIRLEGEAFFEVRKNKSKPFIVIGKSSKTMVLGTSFNINTNNVKGDEIEVRTGKVSFTSIASNKELILLPGDHAKSLNNGQMVKSKIENSNYLSWQTGEMTFDNNSLREVIEVLESNYGVTIQVKDPSMLECKFTGRFTQSSIGEIIQVLSISINLTYTKEGNKYFLSGKGCS